MPDQGLVSFPGLQTFTQAEYTNVQGISPGVCTIEMPLQLVTDLAPSGDLTFTYGDQSVTIPDCVVDFGNVDTSLGGNIARVTIKDRRWRWQFGEVSGHYNLPAPMPNVEIGNNDPPPGQQPLIRPGTSQTPQDLLTFCLDAMQEQNYDLSQLPNDAQPEIHWSHTNPAQAMASLCDQLGCRVVLDLDDSHVIIVPVGQGQPLPDNEFVTFPQEGVQPPVTPSLIRIVANATVYQGYLLLEAVGLDLDGTVRVINSLSYIPQNGWSLEEPRDFPSIQSEPAKTLAHQTIYKWWRPVVPFTAPDGTTVNHWYQLILHDRMLDTYLAFYSLNDTANITAAVEVQGFFDSQRSQAKIIPNSGTAKLYRGSVSIDQERSIVITGDPLYSISDGPTFIQPKLYLKTSFSICDAFTREPIRYTRDRQMNTQNQTPPKVIKNDALCERIRGEYASDFSLLAFTSNHSDGLDDLADFLLNYAQSEYVTEDSFVVSYARIEPIQLDGLVQQVTYTIVSGPGGSAMTKASSNTEHNSYVQKYKVRRDRERAYQASLQANQWSSAAASQQLAAFDKAQG